VARVELARAAVEDIELLVVMLSLPPDTSVRVTRSLRTLEQFPRLGVALRGRWDGLRCLVGPWRWMLLVYEYREEEDRVVVVTVQDARSSSAVTGS
jgi:plasmid stabilization system protein ParE